MEEIAASFKETKERLAVARARIAALEKEDALRRIENATLKKEKEEAELLSRANDKRISGLIAEKQELNIQLQENAAEYEVEMRRAVRAGKKVISDAYQKILAGAKAKFMAKKKEVKTKIQSQEIQSNIDILEDHFAGRITDLHAEHGILKNDRLPKKLRKLEKRIVSDFSISKLSLPQISDETVAPMKVDPKTGAPDGVDQHGTNEEMVSLEQGKDTQTEGQPLGKDLEEEPEDEEGVETDGEPGAQN